MISKNEFIEIERPPWQSIPNGWSSRPPKASYLTKSIVYVNWDEEWEKTTNEWNEKLEKQRELKDEILSYIPNIRIKLKFIWNFEILWNKDEVYEHSYDEEFLREVLKYCKKYKCKKIKNNA